MQPPASARPVPARRSRRVVTLTVLAAVAGGLIAALSVCGAVAAAIGNADDSLLGTWVVVMVVALLGEGVLVGIALGEHGRTGRDRGAANTSSPASAPPCDSAATSARQPARAPQPVPPAQG